MSFVRKGQNQVEQLDASQIGKLEDSGYNVTAVSQDLSVLNQTVATTRNLLPGANVKGYTDSTGKFYVAGTDNTVYDVSYQGPTLKNDVLPQTPTSQPPINVPPQVNLPPNIPTPPTVIPPQVQTVNTLPPGDLGSGKIFSRFDSGDIVPNQTEVITRALWSGNVGNLITFYTSSTQTSTQKRYYYEVFNSASGDCGSEAQFSIAYGHKQGSGSADEGGQINDTPSRAIYGQWKQLCLDPDEQRFTIGGSTTDSIYVLTVNRARMREFVDEGNLEINLQRLSGSQWLTGGGSQNAWTGSNVRVFPTQAVTRLIDDSRVNSATITSAGEVYNIVSGTLEDGIYNSSSPVKYGLFYRRLGAIVLDGGKLDANCSFLTVTGSEVPGDNAYKMFLAMSASARYTDTSGDRLGFQGRSGEKVKSTHYFVRVKNQEYNFSNNPTFVTGSEGDLADPTFIGNPQTYITSVGLYNDNKELLAVGKLSRPLLKNFSREALIKMKLEFAWVGFFLTQFWF